MKALTIYSRIMAVAIIAFLVGCDKADEPELPVVEVTPEEPPSPPEEVPEIRAVTHAEVTFTFTCSRNLYKYYNLTATYHKENPEQSSTDILIRELNTDSLQVVYSYDEFPAKASLEIQYERTAKPIPSGDIVKVCMAEHIELVVDGEVQEYDIDGIEKVFVTCGADPLVNDRALQSIINNYHTFCIQINSDSQYDIFNQYWL